MSGLMIWRKFQRLQLARLTILIAILAALSACGGAKSSLESVVVRDTIVITKERKLVDTLMLFRDTTIYQDRVKLKIEYRDNFVRVEAECPSDTIRVETIKIVNQEKKKGISWEALIGWIIAILSLLVIIKSVVNKLL